MFRYVFQLNLSETVGRQKRTTRLEATTNMRLKPLPFQVWFKNRRAKYRKLKGCKETEEREVEERVKETKSSNDNEPVPIEANSSNKKPRNESNANDRIIGIPARPRALSSACTPQSFAFDPRLTPYGFPGSFAPREWAAYYGGLNYPFVAMKPLHLARGIIP